MNDRNCKTTAWFAVSADGTSVLRVAPGLALGETDTGALALNDADPENRWVQFEKDAGGTRLESSDRAVMTGEDGIPLPGALMEPGMVLRLPNHELYISRDISLPGQAGPVLAVAPVLPVAPVHTADSHEAGSAEVGGDREAMPSPDRGRTEVPPPAAAAAPQPAIPLPRDRPRRIRRRRGRRGWALAVTTAGLVGGIAALPILAPDAADRLRQAVAEGEWFTSIAAWWRPAVPADDLAAVIPEIPLPPVSRRRPVEPDLAQPDDAGGEAADAQDSADARDSADAQDSADAAVEARLARARDLLYEGNVTYPPGNNAVDLITEVLAGEPNHPGARLLLEECSRRLIQTAQRLHESGLHYEARNTLEEVVSFDPDSARARSLLRRWVGSRS